MDWYYKTIPDPLHIETGLDPDPVFFVGSGVQIQTKNIFFPRFLLITYCKYINSSLQRQHVIEKSENSKNHG